jgi:hypothetical protein
MRHLGAWTSIGLLLAACSPFDSEKGTSVSDGGTTNEDASSTPQDGGTDGSSHRDGSAGGCRDGKPLPEDALACGSGFCDKGHRCCVQDSKCFVEGEHSCGTQLNCSSASDCPNRTRCCNTGGSVGTVCRDECEPGRDVVCRKHEECGPDELCAPPEGSKKPWWSCKPCPR